MNMAYREAKIVELENGDLPVRFLQGMGVANAEQMFLVEGFDGYARGEANAELIEDFRKRTHARPIKLRWEEVERLCLASLDIDWLSIEVIDYPGRLQLDIIDGDVFEIESNSEEVFERAGKVLATMGLTMRASGRWDQVT
jgi:hypothetical protein